MPPSWGLFGPLTGFGCDSVCLRYSHLTVYKKIKTYTWKYSSWNIKLILVSESLAHRIWQYQTHNVSGMQSISELSLFMFWKSSSKIWYGMTWQGHTWKSKLLKLVSWFITTQKYQFLFISHHPNICYEKSLSFLTFKNRTFFNNYTYFKQYIISLPWHIDSKLSPVLWNKRRQIRLTFEKTICHP